MNYAEADALLQGRCRKRREVGTFTYLERRDRAIAVSIDSSDKLFFHPDGRIEVAARWVDRLKRRPRINGFLPEPWLSRVFHKHTILYRAQDGPKKGWAVRGLVTVIPNGPIRIKGRPATLFRRVRGSPQTGPGSTPAPIWRRRIVVPPGAHQKDSPIPGP